VRRAAGHPAATQCAAILGVACKAERKHHRGSETAGLSLAQSSFSPATDPEFSVDRLLLAMK